jgi:predicted DNA-binding transcriptional regulator YafY
VQPKVKVNAQVRIVELLLTLLKARAPLPYEMFTDEETWGDERTFRRTRTLLNELWQKHQGVPLLEIVDAEGVPKSKGEGRFLRLADKSLSTLNLERMAVMPAFLQLLHLLKGTILAEEFKPLYQSWYAGLSGKEKRFFDRTEKKFYYFGRGVKRYDDKADLIDEIYDALLKEQVLEISFDRKGERVTSRVLPLTLCLFNSGLYLICNFEDQDDKKPPYKFRIESLVSAKSLRRQPFKYPASYDPARIFDGSFGFIQGPADKRTEVVLEYDRTSWVAAYLRERTWTGNERYEGIDGGRERFRMAVSDLREVSSWVLPMADQVRIAKPAGLRKEVLEMAQRIAERQQG